MKDFSFDEMVDYAAAHTSFLSGMELICNYRNFLIRYDEIRERKRIANFLHMLLSDSCFYKDFPHTKWNEKAIYEYLSRYEI